MKTISDLTAETPKIKKCGWNIKLLSDDFLKKRTFFSEIISVKKS
jgi:hypothetical protein